MAWDNLRHLRELIDPSGDIAHQEKRADVTGAFIDSVLSQLAIGDKTIPYMVIWILFCGPESPHLPHVLCEAADAADAVYFREYYEKQRGQN